MKTFRDWCFKKTEVFKILLGFSSAIMLGLIIFSSSDILEIKKIAEFNKDCYAIEKIASLNKKFEHDLSIILENNTEDLFINPDANYSISIEAVNNIKGYLDEYLFISQLSLDVINTKDITSTYEQIENFIRKYPDILVESKNGIYSSEDRQQINIEANILITRIVIFNDIIIKSISKSNTLLRTLQLGLSSFIVYRFLHMLLFILLVFIVGISFFCLLIAEEQTKPTKSSVHAQISSKKKNA